ncbi:MAG TPA: nuclear transport factor 2 family protein [Phototrophicaceae bacterium]|nr:nuclear transport factor 2 family protein [Phototrophicaceae bacterium]
MAIETQNTTEAVFAHHLQALRDRDVEAIASDYADDAILMMEGAVVRGIEQIRAHFTNAVNGLPAEVLTNIQVDQLEIEGEFVFLLWSSGTSVPRAADTLCIRNGKIVMQSGV